MSRSVHVCLYDDLSKPGSAYRVRIEKEDSDERIDPNGLILCLQSPLFSSTDNPFIPRENESYQLIFIVHQQPFVQLGKINAAIRPFIWYSLGITSLVAILPKIISAKKVLTELAVSETLCYETWRVKKGKLAQSRINIKRGKNNELKTSWPKRLPKKPDLKKIIRELHLNFNSLAKRARVFMPSLLCTMEKVRKSVGEVTKEIIEQETALQNIYKKANETTKHSTTANEGLSCHKRINVSVDALVQLNSALAYILSQSFYGGPPITRNPSLHSCHSLLGIGTAIAAIQRLTEFIIHGFGECPIANAIKRDYCNVTVRKFLTEQSDASNRGKGVDHYIKSRSGQTPKLAYFSSRMGFSEHSYCVTAAAQSLSSADGARRNILTLTHELLHSHVKGLFAALFAEPQMEAETLFKHIQQHRNMAKEYRSNSDCVSSWTVLQYLRYRTFLFCDEIYKVTMEFPGCVVNGHPSKEIEFGPAITDDEEFERFRCSFGYLNEIVVHVLDLHYFYDESERIYLAALWKSWATVPGVADKIEWYILRGLVAISVKNMSQMNRDDFSGLKNLLQSNPKDLSERFEEAVNALITVLEELCTKQYDEPVLHSVLEKLKSLPTKRWLREAFFPCHLFAQIVKQFLYSPALRKYFDSLADPLADRDESGEPTYSLESCEFPTRRIQNPIAFLRDRLLRDIDGTETLDEELRSAWLFLGLASIPEKKYENT